MGIYDVCDRLIYHSLLNLYALAALARGVKPRSPATCIKRAGRRRI